MNKIIAKNFMAALVVFVVPAFAFAYDANHAVLIEGTNHANDMETSGTTPDWSLNNTSGSNSTSSSTQTSSTSSTSTGYANGVPDLSIVGTSRMGAGMADVTLYFDSANADYSSNRKPFVYVEYRYDATGETAATNQLYQPMGARSVTYTLYGLSRGETYSYRAIMKYNGRTYRTSWKSFTMPSGVKTNQGTSATTTGSSTTLSPKTTTTTSVANAIGATAVASSVKSAIYTAGSNHANGVAIGITDTQARVSQDDTIEFTVQYQNTRTTSLMNTELVIQLPEEYEFVRSKSDFEYDESSNAITLPTGRIAAGGAIHSVTFTARAIGEGSRDVKTTATLYYEGGKISASDRDAYHGGSKSVLGASVFGAGFFPQTLFGWVILILLITLIIIAARRYTKPAPAPAPAK